MYTISVFRLQSGNLQYFVRPAHEDSTPWPGSEHVLSVKVEAPTHGAAVAEALVRLARESGYGGH